MFVVKSSKERLIINI